MQENALLKSHGPHRIELRETGCATEAPPRLTRQRFWEIDSFFKCPVVGICLSLAEQRQLLKRADISVKRRSTFEIHEILVASSDGENLVSRRVDIFLNGKFKREIIFLEGLRERDFLDQWRACFESGDMKAAFWVAATRSDLSIDTKREIFGDVHMEMHNTGDHMARLKRLLAREQGMRKKADERHKNEVGCRKTVQKEKADMEVALKQLMTKLALMETENASLNHEIMKLRSGAYEVIEEENKRMREEIEELSRKVSDYAHRLIVLEKENGRLLEKWSRQRDLSAHIKDEMEDVIEQCRDMSECEESCPSFDLCRKRVLIVGGVTRMESLYREMVEGSGGIFEYHDGNIKNGSRKLESSLRRADVVLCPVNCNSHAACQMVKKLGKKYNKPIRMLASSGLNGISSLLGGNGRQATEGVKSR